MEKKNDYRIGFGLDSHAFLDVFDPNHPLILGGISFSDELSLHANSDGDVILHAVFNAISQAIGCRSIGYYADSMCFNQGITDSKEYLKVILEKMYDKNFKIGNIGVTVEAKRPKMEGSFFEMQFSLSKILDINEDQVGINFTSGEGLTDCGKGNGIQVQCICLLNKV